MRIHYFQHVPFESPGVIVDWANIKGHTLRATHLYKNQPFPDFSSFDMLVVMGGPMGAYEENKYPFLKREKVFIENAIKLNKKVLGICLGAQLIADVLGAKIYKNKYKEIGWFPVYLTETGKKSNLFYDFLDEFTPFHWHQDTFEIPSYAVRIAYSEATENQAFIYNDNVVGLQFHLEVKKENVEDLLKNSEKETEEKYVQSSDFILSKDEYFTVSNHLMMNLLDKLEKF